MLEARLADSPVKGVLLDLAAGEERHEGEMAFSMLQRLRREEGGAGGLGKIKIVVFGPHVQAADLAAAKKGGADVVMARGAVAANLPRVLVELNGGTGGLRDQLSD